MLQADGARPGEHTNQVSPASPILKNASMGTSSVLRIDLPAAGESRRVRLAAVLGELRYVHSNTCGVAGLLWLEGSRSPLDRGAGSSGDQLWGFTRD